MYNEPKVPVNCKAQEPKKGTDNGLVIFAPIMPVSIKPGIMPATESNKYSL